MNLFLRFVLLCLMAGSAYAQSSLPACQGSDVSKWTNCFGTFTFAIGDKYVGEFKDGKRKGQGTYTLANGNKYVGEFKDGNFHGQGTYTSPNGNKFVGEFRDNKLNGLGTATLANGNKFVGEFKDNNMNGQGTHTLANGEKYVGEYKDDKRNGQGIEYSPSGSITTQGRWENGIFVQSFAVDTQRFPFNAPTQTVSSS